MYNNTSEKTPFNSKKTSHVFKSTIYSNMLLGPLHTRVHCVRSVNTTQHRSFSYLVRNIPLNFEKWLRFELVTSYHVGSNNMLRNQLNQKLKLMIDTPNSICYILKTPQLMLYT